MEKLIKADTQFYADLVSDNQLSVNGKPMSRGYWNLIISIRDCGMYSKGIKPHRFWKISDVKWYFGIKGSAASMHEQLKKIQEAITRIADED